MSDETDVESGAAADGEVEANGDVPTDEEFFQSNLHSLRCGICNTCILLIGFVLMASLFNLYYWLNHLSY